ncbi:MULTISPECIES: RecB-like helicase [unclassified Helicobacter]|uniref:RecB-like helicase n=1 Tax=unclassified Helicobacter TaxID=2593540 RepID=UPI000CF117CE|nr:MULTISPECIES: RecB-like helicase [unclassified Helicobacter]
MQIHQLLTLRASAGSGKTFALTLRYLGLLFLGAKTSEILALTFTKKAAQEMQERITKALEEISQDKQANIYFQKLQEYYSLEESYIIQQIPRVYQDFFTSSPKITTIDSFFNLVVKKFCWYVGLSKHYTIKKQNQDKINETFLHLLSPSIYSKLLHFFTQQKSISFSFFEEINHDILELHKQETSSLSNLGNEILNIAKEIKQEILKYSEDTTATKVIKTESINALLGGTPHWILDGVNYRFFKKFNLNCQPLFELLQEKIQAYYDLKEKEMLNILIDFVPNYKKARHIINQKDASLDFSDITLKAYEILNQQVDRDFFYFRLDDRINHILIDEFQDTNKIQYNILYPLIEEIKSGSGRISDRSLFFVGDSKQSIYGFRGSDSSIFELISKFTQDENLPYNYRSEFNVIDFNNQVFEKVFHNYIPQQCPKDTKEGYIKVYEKVLESELIQERVLDSIQLLLKNNIQPNDIAILCYTNDNLEEIKSFLASHLKNIPLITETNLKLTQRKQPQILIQALIYAKSSNELYLKNITKLLGLTYDTALNIPAYDPKIPLSKYIYLLMQHFSICDSFAKKFLEISFLYEDIESFLNEIEKIDIDPIKEHLDGIKLLTIHGSKGLEFDHVIVCDRLKNKNSQGPKFIVDENKIWFNQKNREYFDKNFSQALEKEKNKQRVEENNVLYVAFTRAKKSLFVIPKETRSAFETLNLRPVEIGTLITQKEKSSSLAQDTISLPIIQKDYGKQEAFLTQREILRHQDIIFGEAIHYALEYLIGFNLTLDHLKQKLLNTYGFMLDAHTLETIFLRIQSLMKNEIFLQLLDNKKVYAETTFLQDLTLSRIDTLLIGEKEVVILDYKSGSQKIEHQEQVQEYLTFAKSYFKDKQVKGYLIYLWDHTLIKEVDFAS